MNINWLTEPPSNTDLVITQHKNVFVSQEHLEGVDALLLDKHLHLIPHLRPPPSDPNVQGVVAAHLGVRPPTPTIILLQERLVLGTQYKVNWNRDGSLFMGVHDFQPTQ